MKRPFLSAKRNVFFRFIHDFVSHFSSRSFVKKTLIYSVSATKFISHTLKDIQLNPLSLYSIMTFIATTFITQSPLAAPVQQTNHQDHHYLLDDMTCGKVGDDCQCGCYEEDQITARYSSFLLLPLIPNDGDDNTESANSTNKIVPTSLLDLLSEDLTCGETGDDCTCGCWEESQVVKQYSRFLLPIRSDEKETVKAAPSPFMVELSKMDQQSANDSIDCCSFTRTQPVVVEEDRSLGKKEKDESMDVSDTDITTTTTTTMSIMSDDEETFSIDSSLFGNNSFGIDSFITSN